MSGISDPQHGIDEVNFKLTVANAHLDIFRKFGMYAEPYHLKKALILLKEAYYTMKKEKNVAAMYFDPNLENYYDMTPQEQTALKSMPARQQAAKHLLQSLPRIYALALQYNGDLTEALAIVEELVRMRQNKVAALPVVRGRG